MKDQMFQQAAKIIRELKNFHVLKLAIVHTEKVGLQENSSHPITTAHNFNPLHFKPTEVSTKTNLCYMILLSQIHF